jgi:hypothetical protein
VSALPDDYREVVTTALDVIAVLAIACGVFGGLLPYLGLAAAAPAGLFVFVAVRLAELMERRRAPAERGS